MSPNYWDFAVSNSSMFIVYGSGVAFGSVVCGDLIYTSVYLEIGVRPEISLGYR